MRGVQGGSSGTGSRPRGVDKALLAEQNWRKARLTVRGSGSLLPRVRNNASRWRWARARRYACSSVR